MSSRKASILVVDDDIRILRMMQRTLELEGYRVLTASDGEAALNVMDRETPCLVLLDIRMPDMDGYTICRRIREFSQIPVIMVTAMARDEEKVQGLDAGADDYITKPFAANELTARIRAVLRRAGVWNEHSEPVFRSNDLVIEFTRHRVTLGSEELNLTGTDAEACAYLYTVSLTQPMDHDWQQIYLYIAGKVYSQWKTAEMPEDIRVESLNADQERDLARLKAWIYQGRAKIRLERDRVERRQRKEEEAARKKELQPALFEF